MRKKRKIESRKVPLIRLPDEMMAEVLSRLPIKSFLRFRCVSKEWFNLMYSSPSLKLILLMLNVLPWLPVKSLLQFRCVSKTWLRFISDPSFKKVRDLLRTPKQFLLLSNTLQKPKRSIILHVVDLFDGRLQCEFKLTSCYSSYWLFNSCHGLVYFSDKIAKNIYVCNPSTHELVKLPVSPFALSRDLHSSGIGMGYLPESNTYKIIVWFAQNITNDCGESRPASGFESFTIMDGGKLKSSQWMLVKTHPYFAKPPQGFYSGTGFFARGKIYWMLMGNWGTTIDGWTLLAFDVRTEEERIIQPPADWVYRQGWSTNIVVLRGSLCVVETFTMGMRTIIWVLNDGDVWSRPHFIREALTRLLACVPASACNHHPAVGQQVDGFNLVFMPEESRYNQVYYYNMKNRTVSMSSEHIHVVHRYQRAFVYRDTLFSLKPQASKRVLKKKQVGG